MKSLRIAIAGLLVLAASAFGMASMTLAQQATPAGTPIAPTDGYPVAIHQGSCAEPVAQPAWQLDNAEAVGSGEEGEDAPDVVGSATSTMVYETSGAIDFTLDNLALDGHIVAVHASSDEFGTIIACGEIAGVKDDGKVIVPLLPVGGGSIVGVATVDEDPSGLFDLGEDQTQLTIYLFDQSAAEAA